MLLAAILLALAVTTVAGADAERVRGCGTARCDAGQSATTALTLPAGPTVSVVLSRALARAANVSSSVPSPGCVSNGWQNGGSFALCAFPLAPASAAAGGPGSAWAGVVRVSVNASAGATLLVGGNYTGLGSAFCAADDSGRGGVNLPAVDIFGDAALFGPDGVALLTGDPVEVAWSRELLPSGSCPGVVAPVLVTSTGRLVSSLSRRAEAYGYYVNGVPIGTMQFYANLSSPAPSTPSPDGYEPHDGLLRPLAPAAAAGGGGANARVVSLARYVAGGEDGAPPAPTGALRVAALDVLGGGMERLARPWTVDVTAALGGAALAACVPAPDAPERVTVAGPLALPGGAFAVGAACVGGGPAPASTTLFLAGVNASDAGPAGAAWSVALPLEGAAAAAGEVHAFADASQPPGESATFWLAPAGGDAVVAVDGAAGRVVGAVALAAALAAPGGAASCAPLAAAGGVAVEGPPLAAAAASRAPGAADVALALRGLDGAHWLAVVELTLPPGAAPPSGRAKWCARVPGGGAAQGQLAPLAGGGDAGGSTLVFVTAEGVFAVG